MNAWSSVFAWIAPPLVGAFIGYLTNSIAIAMIFRPYEEKRFLGLRIPFTPGIIPKQRKDLAVSIGKMVSKELLTPDAVRNQTSSPRFREGLEKSIANATARLLETRFEDFRTRGEYRALAGQTAPGPAAGNGEGESLAARGHEGTALSADDLPESYAGEPARNLPSLIWELFIRGSGFPLLLDTAIGRGLDYVGSLTIGSLFAKEGSRERFAEKLIGILSSPDLCERVQAWVGRWLDRHIERNSPLSDVFSEGDIRALIGILESLYPDGADKLFSWLDRKEVRKDLENRGKVILRNAIDRFNSFQRFFILAGQFDRNLEENMGSLVADLIRMAREAVQSEETKQKLLAKAGGKLEMIRSRGFADLAADIPGMKERVLKAVSGLFAILRRPGTGDALRKGLEGMESYRDETIASLFSGIFKADMAMVKDSILAALLSGKDREGGSFLYPIVNSLLRENRDYTIGRFIGISGEEKRRIDRMVCDLVIGLIDTKIPEILVSIDIRELVVNKIDSLDIRKMERLIIDVVSRQLQWINVFGGILGAIIGMFQVLLAKLM